MGIEKHEIYNYVRDIVQDAYFEQFVDRGARVVRRMAAGGHG